MGGVLWARGKWLVSCSGHLVVTVCRVALWMRGSLLRMFSRRRVVSLG